MGAHDFDRLNFVNNAGSALLVNQAASAYHLAEGCINALHSIPTMMLNAKSPMPS